METRTREIGTRRWNDLRVAEWLGYKQRRRIRALIHKNLAQLERHGTVVTATERPGCIEYWLNFEQTIAVCALADTPRGREVWELVVKISAAVWNRSQHSVTGVLALRVEFDTMVDGLLRHDFRDLSRQEMSRVQ